MTCYKEMYAVIRSRSYITRSCSIVYACYCVCGNIWKPNHVTQNLVKEYVRFPFLALARLSAGGHYWKLGAMRVASCRRGDFRI